MTTAAEILDFLDEELAEVRDGATARRRPAWRRWPATAIASSTTTRFAK